MKYIIDVPDEAIEFMGSSINVFVEPEFKIGDCKRYALRICKDDITPYTEPNFEDIEDEVWSFAWKIFSMDIGEYAEIFDDKGCSSDYREAKAEYESWKKRNINEIHVGDEVENASHKKGTVINHYISPSNGLEYVRVLYMDDEGNSFISAWEKNDVYKTGKHFDEVEEMLKKMKECDSDD